MASKTKIYLVLEYVNGKELFTKIINNGKLKEDESRRYFQQLIHAVDYCHSRGVYHRDLKPENLLLDSYGVLKILDFGLSTFSQQVRDSYEHGNQSDVIEERDEVRVEAAETGYTVPSPSQGEKKVVQKVCHSGDAMVKSVPGRFLPPHVESRSSQEQQFNSSTHGPETGSPEFSFSGQENLEAKANETQRQEWSANNSSHSNGPSEHLARQKFSSFQMNGSIYKGESSGTEIQVARPCHEIPIELGGVLESLQRAKLSLKQELNRSPQSIREMSLMRAIEAPLPANMKKDPMEIPVRYGS